MASSTPEQARHIWSLRTPEGHGPKERHARYISNECYDEEPAAHDEAAACQQHQQHEQHHQRQQQQQRQQQEHLDRWNTEMLGEQAALPARRRQLDQPNYSMLPDPKRRRLEHKQQNGGGIVLTSCARKDEDHITGESQLCPVLNDLCGNNEAMSGTDTQSLSDYNNADDASGTETQSLSSVDGSAPVDVARTANLPPLRTASRQLSYQDGSGCQVSLNRTVGDRFSERAGGNSFADLVLAGKSLEPGDSVFLTTMSCDTNWVLDRLKPGDGHAGARVTIVAHSDACWSPETKSHTKAIPGFENCRIVFPYMPRCSQRIGESGLGLQHGKLVLVFRKNHLRVLVSSANLTAGNWTQHTNIAWWQDFPVQDTDTSNRLNSLFDPEPWNISESFGSIRDATGFGPTLASYVASLVVGIDSEEAWVLKLAAYDFSAARGQLVMSRPWLGPQSIQPGPTWRDSVPADELLGEVETMVVMPDASYCKHYYEQGRQADGGRQEPKKLLSKIEGIEMRATTRHRSHKHESEPLLRLAVEREVGNELHESLSYDAVGLHLPGESHQQSLFGYLRKCGYGAARRAINAQVMSPLLKHGVIKVEARLKYTHAMALIHGCSRPNAYSASGGEDQFGEVGGVPALLVVSKGQHFEQFYSFCTRYSEGHTKTDVDIAKGLVCLISQLRRPQGLAQLKLATDSSLCHQAIGKSGKHWYEYRYAASSLGTLSHDFLRTFAWAIGGAAGQKGGDCDESAGSQHLEREIDRVWCEDSYVTRPTGHSSLMKQKRKLGCGITLDYSATTPVPAATMDNTSPRPGDELPTAQMLYHTSYAKLKEDPKKYWETSEQVSVPPMKVIWPSDLQIKGIQHQHDDAESSLQFSPEWALDGVAGRRIRQSFLLSGADNALAAVANEIELQRADAQLFRDGNLSHAKVLSCHLCSNATTVEVSGAFSVTNNAGGGNGLRQSSAAPVHNTPDDHNLVWMYIGSANLSAAAWGRPIHSLSKREREAGAGALDSDAVRLLQDIGFDALPWWGRAGQGAYHIANWELGVVLRPSKAQAEVPLQIDWPYRPESLRPYRPGERPALRSTLREIRSSYWKAQHAARQQHEALRKDATAATVVGNNDVHRSSGGFSTGAHPTSQRADSTPQSELIAGYIRNDPIAAMSRVTGAHSDATELAMVIEWVAGLDDDSVHTIYRQDIAGSSFSPHDEATLRDKRARIVSYIGALQREDRALQGKQTHCSSSNADECDGSQQHDCVAIGRLTWAHTGASEISGDEVVLDVAGCQ